MIKLLLTVLSQNSFRKGTAHIYGFLCVFTKKQLLTASLFTFCLLFVYFLFIRFRLYKCSLESLFPGVLSFSTSKSTYYLNNYIKFGQQQGGLKIRIIPAEARYYRDKGWVKSYFLFSYSDYYDPENVHFGSLRAFNEFIVEPGKGFSSHPHAEVEITTIVLEGEITHEDNMGNRGVLGKEDVQCITTGTGIEHSEFNRGKEPLRLYQIWISPSRSNLEPAYSKKKFDPSGWKNRLFPLASGQGFENVLKIYADATIYRASLEKGHRIHFNSKDGRFVFIYISAGELSVNGQRLGQGDQARLNEEETIHLETASFAELVLIDIPVNRGNI